MYVQIEINHLINYCLLNIPDMLNVQFNSDASIVLLLHHFVMQSNSTEAIWSILKSSSIKGWVILFVDSNWGSEYCRSDSITFLLCWSRSMPLSLISLLSSMQIHDTSGWDLSLHQWQVLVSVQIVLLYFSTLFSQFWNITSGIYAKYHA